MDNCVARKISLTVIASRINVGGMTSDEFRAELRELGLSQRALALRLGLAVTTVNRWALELAPVPQYAVAYLELRRELAEISRRLSDAGHGAPAPRRVNSARRHSRARVFAVGDDRL